MVVESLIKNASIFLKEHNIRSSGLDAEIILASIMKVPRENLLLNENLIVPRGLIEKFNFAIKRRSQKEPVAYIIKKKEFWSVDFLVNESTLIPRPETELLVSEIIKFINDDKINILDVGTGSGCILLSLLKELKHAKGIGIDISNKVLNVAQKNSKQLDLLGRSCFIKSSIEKYIAEPFDLIVSNPPYIIYDDLIKLSEDIKNYEPLVALNGGIDGLDLIKKVIYKSNRLIKKNGILAIEIGNNQYRRVSKLLEQNNYFEISKVCDFRGNVRCIISTKK